MEKAELERSLKLPWYRRKAFFQAVVGGLVAIPLVWFYVKDIAVPLYQSDNIKLALENKVAADSLRRAKEKHQRDIEALETQRQEQAQKHLAELNLLKKQYAAIDSIRKALAADYKNLAQKLTLTERERQDLQKKYSDIESQVEAQKEKISELNSQIKQKKSEIPVYISASQAETMIKERGYFDTRYNPDGRGVSNQFDLKQNRQIVFDAAARLMWQQAGSPGYAFNNAREYIRKLNERKFAGYSDWRLPTLEEAMSLMEPKKNKDGLYINPIFDKTQEWIWTTDKRDASTAWLVYFGLGYCASSPVVFNLSYVRAVR